jgi:hypothetical protein
MRRLLALIFAVSLWFTYTTAASANTSEPKAGLVPCSESPAFQQRAKDAKDTVGDPRSGENRFDYYSVKRLKILCKTSKRLRCISRQDFTASSKSEQQLTRNPCQQW